MEMKVTGKMYLVEEKKDGSVYRKLFHGEGWARKFVERKLSQKRYSKVGNDLYVVVGSVCPHSFNIIEVFTYD